MEAETLNINTANDYARDIGAPVYHPHVCIVHYNEMGRIRHTLNRYNVYAIFAQHNFPLSLSYGIGQYATANDALIAIAPGQIQGARDDGDRSQYYGWALLFDPEFIYGTPFEQNLPDYHFFSYNVNEALRLTISERTTIDRIMTAIRDELAAQPKAENVDRIVQDYILLLADYCNRFYERQFSTDTKASSDILARFTQLLNDYYANGLQRRMGLPTVKYCAGELCLSTGYFSDIVRKWFGQNPTSHIRGFIIGRAKSLLASGKTVNETADVLGFEYLQHFTRVFKKATTLTPSQFIATLKKG